MKRLLILSCSATKRPVLGKVAAVDLYDGPAYKVLRGYIKAHPDFYADMDIYILSAEYGLIHWDRPIANYDRKMDKARAQELAPVTQKILKIYLPLYSEVFAFAGEYYRACLGSDNRIEYAAGGIGYKLQALKAWLNKGG